MERVLSKAFVKMRPFIWMMTLCCVTSIKAQSLPYEVYSFRMFAERVIRHHPVSQQAQLLLPMAEGNTLAARGFFDPKILAVHDRKDFDQKDYYRYTYAEVKVPTWYGIDIKATYENNRGEFINPNDNLPNGGLWSVGVELPLLRGLKYDERRGAVHQAEVFAQANENERIIMLNELLLEATSAYVKWQEAYAKYKFRLDNISLAEERLAITRLGYENGDRPAMDTIEARLNLQNRLQELQVVGIEVFNTLMNVNLFVWEEGKTPILLNENLTPEAINPSMWRQPVDSLILIQNELLTHHPLLIEYDLKNQTLQIDQRVLREDLKPDVRLQWNPLLRSDGPGILQSNINDYKIGAALSYPLLTRKARGKIAMNQVYQEDLQYALTLKRQSIINQLGIEYNNAIQASRVIDLSYLNVNSSKQLFDFERIKFDLGESSVFLLNTRETAYIAEQLKLIEHQVKYIDYMIYYLNYTGQLYYLMEP